MNDYKHHITWLIAALNNALWQDYMYFSIDRNAAAALNVMTSHLVLHVSNSRKYLMAVLTRIQGKLCDKTQYVRYLHFFTIQQHAVDFFDSVSCCLFCLKMDKTIASGAMFIWHNLKIIIKSYTVNSRYLEVVGTIFYKFKLPDVQINLHFG